MNDPTTQPTAAPSAGLCAQAITTLIDHAGGDDPPAEVQAAGLHLTRLIERANAAWDLIRQRDEATDAIVECGRRKAAQPDLTLTEAIRLSDEMRRNLALRERVEAKLIDEARAILRDLRAPTADPRFAGKSVAEVAAFCDAARDKITKAIGHLKAEG